MLKSRFEVVGKEALMASLPLEPSVPMCIRKGCLVSVMAGGAHGSGKTASLVIGHKWVNFWTNLARFRSWNSSLYHVLTTSGKENRALVAPNISRGSPWLSALKLVVSILSKNSKGITITDPQRSIYPLELDGTQDWNVWGRDSLIAFEQNDSLDIKPASLSSSLKRDALFSHSHKYQVVTGRGSVLLGGYGDIYSIELKNSTDDIVINAQNILAVSGKGQTETMNAIENNPFIISHTAASNIPEFTSNVQELAAFEDPKQQQTQTIVQKTVKEAARASKAVWHWISYVYKKTVIFSNNNGHNITSPAFVKIKGPRTIIIQTSHETTQPVSVSTVDILPRTVENAIPEVVETPKAKSDSYINYATVQPDGNVTFRSVSNFNETIAGRY